MDKKQKDLSCENGSFFYRIECYENAIIIEGTLTAHDIGEFIDFYAMKGYSYVRPGDECIILEKEFKNGDNDE
jgi:hypothetical protein